MVYVLGVVLIVVWVYLATLAFRLNRESVGRA